MKTTKEIGDFGERLAVHFLRRRGYIVRERNLRVGHAEVDIVATTLPADLKVSVMALNVSAQVNVASKRK